MKKLFLVIFCTMIIGVFVGFNYLLWDREDKASFIEDLKNTNEANNASINALSRQIKSLEDENDAFRDRVAELEKSNEAYEGQVALLEETVKGHEEALKAKDITLLGLKQLVDSAVFEEPVREWAEAIDKGDYETAYRLYAKDPGNPDLIMTLENYSSLYKSSTKSLRLKSVKLYVGEEDGDNMGEIILEAVLEAKNTEGAEASRLVFSEGANDRYFTLTFDGNSKSWVISRMTTSP